MAKIISNDISIVLENLTKNNEYIIGIRGKGIGILRTKNRKYSVKDIKRVLFRRGEEREAIKLFVKANRGALISDSSFRQKSWFYPQILFKYYIQYLFEGKLEDNIPPMFEYALKRSRKHTRNAKFCQYMRERCPELLKNSESLLHDCDFLNKFYNNKIDKGSKK